MSFDILKKKIIVIHNKMIHIAHYHFFWHDLCTGIKVFILVNVFGIGLYWGHMCFTNTLYWCNLRLLSLCTARKYFRSESYGPWASYYLWKQTFSWNSILYFQSVIFDEIELTDLSVAECSTKNINHSFQVSAFGGVDLMMTIFLLTCTTSM